MIKPGFLEKMIYEIEFVPHAILAVPVEEIIKRFDWPAGKGHDDLDEYLGTAGWLDGIPFAVMRYKGHPKDTSTIYLSFDTRDIEKITDLIARITSELKLPAQKIKWQRKDNPEL